MIDIPIHIRSLKLMLIYICKFNMADSDTNEYFTNSVISENNTSAVLVTDT